MQPSRHPLKRPIIQKLTPARRRPPGCGESLGQTDATPAMLQQADDAFLGKPRLPYKAGLSTTGSAGDFLTQGHIHQGNRMGHRVNPPLGDNLRGDGYLSLMAHPRAPKHDPWPQRERFRLLVDEALEALLRKHPKSSLDDRKAMLSEAMGTTANALKQYYSGRVKIPGREMIQNMAKALGCKPGDLLSDPKRFPKAEDARPEVESFMEYMFAVAKDAPASELEAMKRMVQAGQELRRGKK